MRSAYLGEPVLVLLDPKDNNGATLAPGWVVRVWERPGTHGGIASQTVNVRAMTDTPDLLWLGSVHLFDERPQPEDLDQMMPHVPGGYGRVAFRNDRMEGF